MDSPYLPCTASQTLQKPKAPSCNLAPPPPEPAHLPWKPSAGNLWGDESGYTTCTMGNNVTTISTGRSDPSETKTKVTLETRVADDTGKTVETFEDVTYIFKNLLSKLAAPPPTPENGQMRKVNYFESRGWSWSLFDKAVTEAYDSEGSETSTLVGDSETGSSADIRQEVAPVDWNKASQREQEAQKLLQTSIDPDEIRRICLFFPFQDPNTCLDILSIRSPTTLNAVLRYFNAKCNDNEVNLRKATMILGLIGADLLGSPIWNREWSPPVTTNSTTIADAIDSEMSLALNKVPFRELVRAACHCQSDAITDLLHGLSTTSSELRRRTQELYKPKEKYELCEEKLKSPLAYWAVSSLHCTENLPDPRDALTSILLPIQRLFAKELSLIQLLKRLEILAVLYQDNIVDGGDGGFTGFESTDFSFLEDVCAYRPQIIAKQITDRDVNRFRQARAQDFVLESPKLKELSSQWNRLASDVKACSVAYKNLVEPFSEVVKQLLRVRNYYSATAFLSGLQNAGHYPKNLSMFWKLLCVDNTYEFYRTEWSKNPGLPFLYPHMYELRHGRGLSELLRFTTFSGWNRWTKNDFRNYEGNWDRLYLSIRSAFASIKSALFSLQPLWISRFLFQDRAVSVIKLYTFGLVSNLGYCDELPNKLNNIFERHQVLSSQELPDESWEVVAPHSCLPELMDELRKTFPSSHFGIYDPCEPSKEEVEQFTYEVARCRRLAAFWMRAESMIRHSRPAAAEYYHHWLCQMGVIQGEMV